MEQFAIKRLVPLELAGFDVSFTNSALWMGIAVLLSSTFLLLGAARMSLVPGRIQMASESLYNFIADMIEQNAGEKAKRYFPFIFTLFVFILTCNLLGMIPGFFHGHESYCGYVCFCRLCFLSGNPDWFYSPRRWFPAIFRAARGAGRDVAPAHCD